MSIQVRFTCGHQASIAVNLDAAPVCPTCGETTVARVKARPPRFTGVASGPYCEHRALDAVPVNLAPKGPLTLKESD